MDTDVTVGLGWSKEYIARLLRFSLEVRTLAFNLSDDRREGFASSSCPRGTKVIRCPVATMPWRSKGCIAEISKMKFEVKQASFLFCRLLEDFSFNIIIIVIVIIIIIIVLVMIPKSFGSRACQSKVSKSKVGSVIGIPIKDASQSDI